MIDATRIAELQGEIGAEDLGLVLNVYLDEAREVLDRIGPSLDEDEHGRAVHFLRSGAINLGLSGVALAAEELGRMPVGERAEGAVVLRHILMRTAAELHADLQTA